MRKKADLKRGYHVLTVRFLDKEWAHLELVRSRMEKKYRRNVTYTEIIVDSVMGVRRRG